MNWSIDRVVSDTWSGVLCAEDEIRGPSLDDMFMAIELLDAEIHTIVTLFGCDGLELCIGGGQGRYIAYVSASDQDFWNLLSLDDDRHDAVLLNAGGQEGEYESRQIIDKPSVLRAAKTFFDTGLRDSALRWEKQV
jgi:hypothetical protein